MRARRSISTLKPNQCGLFEGRIIHGAEANTSDTRRAGYAMRYFPTTTKIYKERLRRGPQFPGTEALPGARQGRPAAPSRAPKSLGPKPTSLPSQGKNREVFQNVDHTSRLTPEQVDFYHENGYLLFDEPVFPQEKFDRLKELL